MNVQSERPADESQAQPVPSAPAAIPPPPMPTGWQIRPLNSQNLEEMWKFAQHASKISDPKAWYRGKPYDALCVIRRGDELGLSAMTSLETIMIINGKTSVWGDGLLAICYRNTLFDPAAFKEWTTGEPFKDDYTWHCTMRRRVQGAAPKTWSFSVADAKRAGLWDRGVWPKYPNRLGRYKARNTVARDVYADVLLGLYPAEEMVDALLDQIDTTSLQHPKTASAIEAEILGDTPPPPAEAATEPEPEEVDEVGHPGAAILDDVPGDIPVVEPAPAPASGQPAIPDDAQLRLMRNAIRAQIKQVSDRQIAWAMNKACVAGDELAMVGIGKLDELAGYLRSCIANNTRKAKTKAKQSADAKQLSLGDAVPGPVEPK